MRCPLLFDVLADDRNGRTATATGQVGRRPQRALPIPRLQVGPFLAQQAAGYTLQTVHEVGDRHLRRVCHLQVNMIVLAAHLKELRLEVGTDLGEDRAQPFKGVVVKHAGAVLGEKDQVDVK